jgi:hypothetical protein
VARLAPRCAGSTAPSSSAFVAPSAAISCRSCSESSTSLAVARPVSEVRCTRRRRRFSPRGRRRGGASGRGGASASSEAQPRVARAARFSVQRGTAVKAQTYQRVSVVISGRVI